MNQLFAPGVVAPLPGISTSDGAKRAVRIRSRGMCERCGEPAREYHHRTYEHHGNEMPQELEHLCVECHRNVHFDAAGRFWLDENEKLAHWSTHTNQEEK